MKSMTRIVMQIPLPAECFMHNFPVCGHTNQHFAVMAVLIQIPPDSCAAIRAAFTFHYGSTYTIWDFLSKVFLFLIYIPLWFYLYENPSGAGLEYTYLHSTMVLLIHSCRPCYLAGGLSFTFHYGSTYTINSNRYGTLYQAFTFHYGSTYTNKAYRKG